MCSVKDLVISDTSLLPSTTFTHVNNGTLTRSWLDHCVSSQPMHNAISNISIDDSYLGSDHFPMHVTFNLKSLPLSSSVGDSMKEKINWNFTDINLSSIFYNILLQKLEFDPRHQVFACQGKCDNIFHHAYLESFWNNFVETVQQVGKQVFGIVSPKKRCIPGWNDFVRDFYIASKEAFRAWKENGCPRFGHVACLMRRSRADFKYILRQCRLYEDDLRAMALSNKLQNNEVVPFWREIQSIKGGATLNLPGRVDSAVGSEAIADLWKHKFGNVLNSVNDQESRDQFFIKLLEGSTATVPCVTLTEIKLIVKKLANNKAIGLDAIPNEFYKYAPPDILVMISIVFNSFLNHSFLPKSLMHVLIVPLLKGKLKDPSNSSNYRLIAIAKAASKIFETIIFERIADYLDTSDNQFGFKPKHSTELCVYALKEVIHYYRNLTTPVYLCFVDIKSAFDRVESVIGNYYLSFSTGARQ